MSAASRTLFAPAGVAGRKLRIGLARLGRASRRRASFVLVLASVSFGVVHEAARVGTWRRTVRAEFRRALYQALAGGVATVLVTSALIGLGLVYQALFWLGEAGQEGLIGSTLVTVLVREGGPVLVGLILLGRSGTVAIAEIGALQAGGHVRALEAQGLDPLQLIVLPRACAFAAASYTLSMIFVVAALFAGFVAGSLLDAVTMSMWSLFDMVLLAVRPSDFVVFPAKTVTIGVLVALTACLTGLAARPGEGAARLLPRGFVRGVLAILLTSAVLSLAV